MYKKLLACISVIIAICCFTACNRSLNENTDNQDKNSSNSQNEQMYFESEATEELFVDTSYQNSEVSIAYPYFAQDDMKEINQNVLEFVSSIAVKIYGEDYEDLQLEMTYKVAQCNSSYLSIVFEGLGNVKTSAHPNNLYLTRNYELNTQSIVKLSDVCNVDYSFAQTVYNSVLEQSSKELGEVFKVTYKDVETLLEILKNCDEFSENGSNCWSSFATDGIVISIPLPYVGGDHLEVTIP